MLRILLQHLGHELIIQLLNQSV